MNGFLGTSMTIVLHSLGMFQRSNEGAAQELVVCVCCCSYRSRGAAQSGVTASTAARDRTVAFVAALIGVPV